MACPRLDTIYEASFTVASMVAATAAPAGHSARQRTRFPVSSKCNRTVKRVSSIELAAEEAKKCVEGKEEKRRQRT